MPYVTWFRGTKELWEQQSIMNGALKSAREHLTHNNNPKPFKELSVNEIATEIIARVGIETAMGTVNTYSHFIPLGTNRSIASGFGHGPCFMFLIECFLIYSHEPNKIKEELEISQNKGYLEAGSVPVFKGGNFEFLAYTGTLVDLPKVLNWQDPIPETYATRTLQKLAPKWGMSQEKIDKEFGSNTYQNSRPGLGLSNSIRIKKPFGM